MDSELRILRHYLDLLWRRPLTWLAPLVVVAIIGTMVVLAMPRSYVSAARVVVQSSQISNTLVVSTVTNERLQFFEQMVFSRDNLVALADKFKLFSDARNGMSSTQLAELVRNHITLQVTQNDPADPTPDAAVFTIGYEASTPQLAADVTAEIIQMLIIENREARMSQASEARQFLQQEVAALKVKAEQLDHEMGDFVSDNEAQLPSRLPIYTTEMQELQQELLTIQTASASLSADARLMETQLALASAATTQGSQLENLKAQLATQLTTFSETHPDIVSLRARIRTLEASLADQSNFPQDASTSESNPEIAMLKQRIVAATQQQAAFVKRRADINERLAWLRTTIGQMPSKESELAGLQRRQDAAEANLAEMQGRLDTALVSERLENAQQDAQIRVIDSPEVSLYPAGNGRTRGFMIVAGLSIVAGLIGAFLLDLFDRTIKGRQDLKPLLEGATLIVLPEWTPARSRRAAFNTLAITLATAATYYLLSLPDIVTDIIGRAIIGS